MTEQGLKVEGLVAGYDRLIVLHELDLEVAGGELLAVIGANGAGKTTLLRAVSGLVKPRAGTVILNGKIVTGLSTENLARRGLGHVPENRLIFPSLSVEDNLQLGRWTRRKPNPERREMILEMFPRLQARLGLSAGSMSGGEQQMLALGRALMADPGVLILDEPSLGLAPKVVGEIMGALARLRDELGLAIVLVEQNTKAAFSVADHVLVMERGRVTAQGTPQELQSDDAVRRAYLGGSDVHPEGNRTSSSETSEVRKV